MFLITTTGTQGVAQPLFPGDGYVPFADLGKVPGYLHPTLAYDLEEEFTRDEIKASSDIFNEIAYGWITVTDGNGNNINSPSDLEAQPVSKWKAPVTVASLPGS